MFLIRTASKVKVIKITPTRDLEGENSSERCAMLMGFNSNSIWTSPDMDLATRCEHWRADEEGRPPGETEAVSGDEAARSEEFQGDGRAQIRASTLAVAAVCTTGRGPNAICAPLNSGRTLARRAIRRRRLLLALRSLGDDRNAGTRSFSRHGRKNVELPNDYANDIATRLGREAKHRGGRNRRDCGYWSGGRWSAAEARLREERGTAPTPTAWGTAGGFERLCRRPAQLRRAGSPLLPAASEPTRPTLPLRRRLGQLGTGGRAELPLRTPCRPAVWISIS
ncbi:unnamed protein product [Nesidiocoris tenuis]|uniref:Uncharacterized protein n=1 Tax=Nesidiocoris tenuis TaxID=355587 RepID=A0A6H5H824_9HEMI|nr:unnamed protein product [Nesidiocoris tenuis]